jgi:Cu(I)/Ag(I) efflux system membrane fusion protein
MFAQLRLEGTQHETALVIPSEAVIRSGTRNLVIVALDGNRFQPVEVATGRDIGDRTTILKVLSAGDQVVTSGQFLIDSEASLKGVIARMDHGIPDDNKADAAMQGGKIAGDKP